MILSDDLSGLIMPGFIGLPTAFPQAWRCEGGGGCLYIHWILLSRINLDLDAGTFPTRPQWNCLLLPLWTCCSFWSDLPGINFFWLKASNAYAAIVIRERLNPGPCSEAADTPFCSTPSCCPGLWARQAVSLRDVEHISSRGNLGCSYGVVSLPRVKRWGIPMHAEGWFLSKSQSGADQVICMQSRSSWFCS